MDLGLRGRRALITGGSRGIGFAVAEALAAEGAAVGLVARDAAGLAEAAGRLEPRGVPVATAAADVTDTPALQRAVAEIAGALGGLDHLVANAGGTVGTGNLTSAADDEFTATFALNAGHAVELIRAVRAVAGGEALLSPSVTKRLIAEFATRAKEPTRATELDHLTDREREVMALVAEGLSNEEIAERLIVSPATAKTHVSRAMGKLHARDRAQLVVIAYESGLVRPGWAG